MPAAKIEQLKFPVVVLFGNSAARLSENAAELTKMHVNYLSAEGTPLLIDSAFNIYELAHLQSTHGGLWLMSNPSGTTDVTFELKPEKHGIENARALFARQLEKQIWRRDVPERNRTLATKTTLPEMCSVLQNDSGD